MKPLARVGAVAAAAVVTAGLALGGGQLPAREPRPIPPAEPSGRTITVCPTSPVVNAVSAVSWGRLGVRPIDSDQVTTVGVNRGRLLTGADKPMLMVAEGRQNQGSAASAYRQADNGTDRGLSLARCAPPATSAWFTGLYAGSAGPTKIRSEVLLVNPDDAQAEVDLRFFGPNGQQSAPGGRGLTVPARSERKVGLESLMNLEQPVGMEVRTTKGRVAATVRQQASAGPQPAGADWQVASASPAPIQVVPGVPDGPGSRDLVITNPGDRRTTVKVEVVGPDGTFAPADAATAEINGHATVSLPVTRGLNGLFGAVRVTADQPVVASVVSRSSERPNDSDVAVQPSATELTGTSIGAVAVAQGVTGAVVVTNSGTRDVNVPMRLVNADGKELMAVELRVPASRTAFWELKQVDVPAAVQIRTPRDAQLHAGVVLTNGPTPVSGLATAPISVPEQATAGLQPEQDPAVGR